MEVAPSYGLITSEEELRAVVAKIAEDGVPFGFDIETGYDGESRWKAQLHPEENFIAGLSLSNELTWARYIPLRHDSGVNLDNALVAELVWPLLWQRDAEGLLLDVAHGAIFEKRCMSRWFMQYLGDHPVLGAAVRAVCGYFGVRSCTLNEAYVEAEHLVLNLKDLTFATFGHRMTEIMELFPSGLTNAEKDSIRFNGLDQHDPKVYSYACEDALWCLAHHRKRFPKLRNHLIYILEMALLEEVLCDTADSGLYYDWNLIRDASRRAHEFLPLYEQEVRESFAETTGQPCTTNFASPKQLSKLLYEDMGLPVIKRTDKGAASTNAKEVLVNFVDEYPAIRKYVEWKELQTLCSSFLDSYEGKFGYAADGRTHPNLMNCGTVSGRFSHDSPNYAQTSKKKYKLETRTGAKFEFQLRRAIAAPPGWYILGFDYSMVELRAVAGEAQETALLEDFRNGVDVHRKTAALFTGKPFEDITDDERQVGKTGNFSLGYGQSAQALAERLGCTLEHAEQLYAVYHTSYPRLNKKRQEVIRQAQRDGFVITKFGRKVPLPDIFSPNRKARADAERTAGNVFVQGPGSGDYPKMAMVRSVRALKAAGLQDDVKLVMNVHDALEYYVRTDIPPDRVIQVLAPAVVFPVPGWPPIVADWHMGLSWADLKELEVLPGGSVRVKKKGAKPAPKEEAPSAAPGPPVPVHFQDAGGPVADVPVAAVPVRPAPAVPDGPPRKLVIECRAMPTVAAVKRLMASLPQGQNTAVLRTPDGDVTLPGSYVLSPDNGPEVSVILGGAIVRYDESSVDMAALGAGLAV